MAVALPVDRHVQNEALRIIYAFEAVAAVFIMLRIWSRFLLQKSSWSTLMKLSDLCMGIAFVLSIGETIALAMVTKRGGLGLHITDIIALTPTSLDEQVITNKWNISNQLLYNPILGFVKASILLLYLRLVDSIRNLRIACYGIMAFNFALMIATFVADLMQCLPVEYNWNSPYMDIAAQKAAGADPLTGMKDGVVVKGGKCFHQTDFYVATAGLSLLTDIMVMAIPIAMVWGLQMKLKKKIIVVGILTLGLAVTAVGLARLPIVHWMFSPKNPDPFYTIGFTTTAMETGLAIATACVPDLAPLAARLFPAYFGSSAYPSNYPSNLSRKGYAAESRRADISKGTVRRNRSMDADSDDAGSGELYMMQGWRGEVTAEVKSDARAVIMATHGSEEAIVPPHTKEKGGITKTTQFVIQNEADEEGKRWSAV